MDRASLDVVSWPVHKLGRELPPVHECVRVLAWEVDGGRYREWFRGAGSALVLFGRQLLRAGPPLSGLPC